jgi:beta-N-acetylhexosaminidase
MTSLTEGISQTEGMSREELIGQLFVVGFPGPTVTPEIVDLIQNYHVGGIVLFSRNLHDIQQIRQLTHDLQMVAQKAGHRYPLLISVDQENGMVRRFGDSTTIFPGNMTLGAIASPQLTRDVAQATGVELKALGINMNLAPVADVNNNPANPVIGIRSFGEDPQRVAQLLTAMLEGYREAGIITCLKHFPGHGDTAVDSHLALPSIPYPLARLEQLELIPFQRGIEAGADSIMIAHLYLPALMPAEATVPATVSPHIVRDLLRTKLDYTGVIITDCLEMNAVSETIGVENGAVMAIQAGNDLVLISHTYERQKGSIEATRQALEAGQLEIHSLQEASERVLQLKARTLSWDDLPTEDHLSEVGTASHQQLRDTAYELSTTVVRDQHSLLPLQLSETDKLLVLTIQPEAYTAAADESNESSSFVEQIRQRHANVEEISIIPKKFVDVLSGIDDAIGKAAMIIIVTVNANLDHYQAEFVHHVLKLGRPSIGLAVYNPYDLLAFPELGSYIVTYEYTAPALAAAVRVLFGEIPAQGKLPVSLPGLYPLVP